MTTITQKRKLSKSAWFLIILFFVVFIAVVITATIGIIDLSWLAAGFLGIYVAVSTDLVLAILLTVGEIAFGVFLCYIGYRYFIGQKVTTTMPTYMPQGQTLSQPAQTGTKTEIG